MAGAGDVDGAVQVTVAAALPAVAVNVAGAAGGATPMCTGSTMLVVAGFAVMR
jgi:membrane protease subunit (stomatin/prohibitin family)